MGLGGWQKRIMGGAKGLMHHLPIAVDFGVGSLKVLQVAQGDPPTLVAAALLQTPDEYLTDHNKRLSFQLDALPELVKSLEFRGNRTVCSIPAACSMVKHMQFQTEPGVSLGSLVQSAIPAQLGCDPAAIVFRHSQVAQVGKKTEVICMATARETVQRLMNSMKAAKLEPVGMHSEFHAIIRAFDPITRRARDSALTSLYLDIGAGATKVAIANGRELVFARTIDLGGRHLDAAVSKQLRLSIAEARERRLMMADLIRKAAVQTAPAAAPAAPQVSAGMALLSAAMRKAGVEESETSRTDTALLEDRRHGRKSAGAGRGLSGVPDFGAGCAEADLTEPLEILTDEITMCMRYHESLFPDRKVGRTVFVGGEARHLGLCQHVARMLKLPAQVGDPTASVGRSGEEPVIGVDFNEAQPGWAVALGLCLSPTDL
jgi:Tfp pilus assembly PilM family ATPase